MSSDVPRRLRASETSTLPSSTSTSSIADDLPLPVPSFSDANRPQCHIHESARMRATIRDTLKESVRISLHRSGICLGRTGMFSDEEQPLPVGQLLFKTDPVVMCRCVREDADTDMEPGDAAQACDYCFYSGSTLTMGDSGDFCRRIPIFERCTGCGVLAFCSEDCQARAWSEFHRFECDVLQRAKCNDEMFLTLLRLFLLDKNDQLRDIIWEAMGMLPYHSLQDASSTLRDNVKRCAQQVAGLIPNLRRDGTYVERILRTILPCSFGVPTPDCSSRVLCLEAALALINHSCNPNAFMYIEGKHVHVRALRPIMPGEEITVEHVDSRHNVFVRQDALMEQCDIQCNCSVCQSELYEAHSFAKNKNTDLAILKSYHKQLIPRAFRLLGDFGKATTEERQKYLIGRFADMIEMGPIAIPGRSIQTSDVMKPLPWLRMAAASTAYALGDLGRAVRLATESLLLFQSHGGPHRANDLRLFVNILHDVCCLRNGDDSRYTELFSGSGGGGGDPYPFPSYEELRAFALCCFAVYEMNVVELYGQRSSFSKAVLQWGRMVCPQRQLVSRQAGFGEAAKAGQQKLLRWCLRTRSATAFPIQLPSKEQFEQLARMGPLTDQDAGSERTVSSSTQRTKITV